MAISRNLIAGFASSAWAALVGVAIVPLYLKYLGIEAYGLIGFFATTQALLQFLDMGLAPTINREVARESASGNFSEVSKLLYSLAIVYWIVAGLIAVGILLGAPTIAGHWLQSNHFSQREISHAIMLMGLVIACRWPIGLYQGALIGAHRLMVSSTINIVMTTLSSFGAVAVLAFISPTIHAFFIWQACMGFIYAMVIRIAAWSVIGHPTNAKFDVAKLKSIWRFSVGMSGISLSALAFTQLDKVILSKMLELEAFGQYMLATVVVSGLYVLISPVFNIIYPRFSAMVASGERDKLVRWYRLGTRGFATLLFSITLTLIVFSEELIRVWTQNPLLASKAAPLTSLLVLGSALNGVMFFPYALQLSYGLTWIPLAINGTLMCFLVPMVFFLAQKYGALGGAIAWLTVETVYVLLGPWLTHRYLLKGLAFKWQFVDVGLPLVVVAFVGVVGFYLFKDTAYSDYVKLVAGGGMSLIAVLLMLVVSKELREVVFTYARNNKN